MSPMVMPGRLYIPTLIPGWAKPPPTNEDDMSAPLLRSQSAESSLQSKPTYHNIIESHLSFIESQIKPLVSSIENEGHRKVNDFELGSSIGYGQFGRVYKAHSDGHIYAIKRVAKKPLNAQQYSMNQIMRQIQLWKQRGNSYNLTADEAVMIMNVQKCRWEIYILSRLHSRYVVKLYQCLDSSQSKAIWIVNKWCDLGELEWKRDSVNEIPLQWSQLMGDCNTVLKFVEKALQDLVQGLVYLQKQGCIHRDIKPSNILVDGRERLLKLSDFGCSILSPRALPFKNDVPSECFQAELNKIVGTPTFIAPELCQFGNPGAHDVKDGFKLDVWSVGVTLYGLLYNELPFYGESEFATYHKVIHNSLKNRMNGDKINDLIIGRMLEKDPQVRIDAEKLHKLVILNHAPSDDSLRQSKTIATTEKKKSASIEKNPTGFHKFFSKFLKRKKKDINRNGSVTSATDSSSTNVPVGRTDPQSYCQTDAVVKPKPSITPRNSIQNNREDVSDSSVDSSLSSFEEPVRVSDDFLKQGATKEDSLSNNGRENMSKNASDKTNEYQVRPSVQDLGSQRLEGTTYTDISHDDERRRAQDCDPSQSKSEVDRSSNEDKLRGVGTYDIVSAGQGLLSPQRGDEPKRVDAYGLPSSIRGLAITGHNDEARRVDKYDCLPSARLVASPNVDTASDIGANHDDDDDDDDDYDDDDDDDDYDEPTRIDNYDRTLLNQKLASPIRDDEPRRVDNPGPPSSAQELGSPIREDEPRRIDSYGLIQNPAFLSHSHHSSTELSTIPSFHGAFESRTPERSRINHSRNASNLDSQRSRDTSFQVTTNDTTRDSYRGTSSATSKEPSFQLSVPPEIIQEGSPRPVKLISRPSDEPRIQFQDRHRPSASISTSSSSPIKLPTPIRALIHIGNSPVKQDSPIKENSNGHQIGPHRTGSLAHSKDISNFQIYIEANGATPMDKHGSILTGDLIERYLNYADNS